MKYVVRYEEAGETVSLFDAPSLLEAVRLKQQVEECYNKMHRCNRIFLCAKQRRRTFKSSSRLESWSFGPAGDPSDNGH